jgi:hypothetical protein
MSSKSIIINSIEPIIQLGTKKQLISGIDEFDNKRIIYVESWIKKNIGDEFYFIEKIEADRVLIFPDDQKIQHPVFQIGEMYKFKLIEIRSKKDNEQYFVFLGIDSLEYEIKKFDWMVPFVQEIGKEYNLLFEKLNKGRIHLRFYQFYEINSIEKINGIKEYFNSSLLEDDKNYFSHKKQYENKDNKWVLTFSNHLGDYLYSARNRKDWMEFKKINLILYGLEKWIISSGYLQLFKKIDSDKIKNRITESRKLNNIFLDIIEMILSYKEESYILDLKDEITDKEEFIIIQIVILNPNILDNLFVLKKIFNYINTIKINKNDLTHFLSCISHKIYNTNKDLRDNNFNNLIDIKNDKIEHLIYLNVIIYNISLLYNIKIKPKLYLIKIVSLLSNLNTSHSKKYLDFKKKIFNNSIKFEILEELDLKYIIEVLDTFNNNSTKDIINYRVNSQHKVEVIGKIKNGFIVLLNDNIAILPNIFLFKEKVNDLNIGDKIELYIRESHTEFNLFVLSSYKNNRKIDTQDTNEIEIQDDFDYNINDTIKGLVTNVVDYGVFISTVDNQKGLLHKKNIHPYFNKYFNKYFITDNEVFLNILNIDKTEGRMSFGNTTIFNDFFDELNHNTIFNIKIISLQNGLLNLNINDKVILPLNLYDINLDNKISLEDISSFSCKIQFYESVFNFLEFSNVIYKDQYSIIDLKNLFNELSFTIEEVGVNIENFTKKVQLLEVTNTLYRFSSNNRSYFIHYYILYIKLLEDFTNNDNHLEINNLIIEIESNSQLINSFKSFEFILNHLKLISCFEQINQPSFYKLIDFYFQDGYRNISKEILKYNLLTFEKNDLSLKTKIKVILSKEMVDQISSDRIFGDIDVFDNIDNNEDLKLKEVLTIISNGENNKVEFKESFAVPTNDQSKINKKIENINLKISSNEIDEVESNDIIFEIKSNKSDVLIHAVLKTIVAFANTKGGDLFIGVDDSGNITGLGPDYSKFYKHVNSGDIFGLRDKFKLNFDEFINNWVDPEIRNLIEIDILNFKGLDFCHINVQKKISKNLLFLYYDIDKKTETKIDLKTWYFRGIANSRPYTSEQLVSYYTTI